MTARVNCVFHHNGECDHTGEACTRVCRNALIEIPGLTYRDHFEIFEKRRVQHIDRRLKHLAIVISVLALSASAGNVLWQILQVP
jgi:hypothetical protein